MVASSSGDVLPFGAAIRNWGPTDQVYVAVDWHDGSNATLNYQFNWAELFHYTCSDGDDCATATLNSTDDLADPIHGRNLTHVALGIHKPSIIELHALVRQKLQTNCDNDLGTTQFYDNEQAAADLLSVSWNHVSGPNGDQTVTANIVGTCENVGVTRARFLDGDRWGCYTHTVSGSDRLACNDSDGATSAWLHEQHMAMSSGGGKEDHPSFAFYGSSDALLVSGTRRNTGNNPNTIDLHFLDESGDPIVQFEPPTASPRHIEYNDTEASGGVLYTVYVDGHEGTRRVMFQSCDTGSVDCTQESHWTANEDVVADSTTGYHFDAEFSQIAVDGERQFVVWQYDSGGETAERWRVAVATRCGTGAWTIEDVRTATNTNDDQFIAVGRPSLVLNRDEGVAHVVLTEGIGYPGWWTMQNVTATDVFWYRKGYSACD